jgi:hypothetical protein
MKSFSFLLFAFVAVVFSAHFRNVDGKKKDGALQKVTHKVIIIYIYIYIYI